MPRAARSSEDRPCPPKPQDLSNYILQLPIPCFCGSEPGIKIRRPSKASPVGVDTLRGHRAANPGYQRWGVRSKKGGGSTRPLPTRHYTLLPHLQPHCRTPFPSPSPSLLINKGLGPWTLPNVCATHWFRPLLLLSGTTGPCPASLDQTVPCRVRKSASSRRAESGPTCLPLKPGAWSQPDFRALFSGCKSWCN